MKNPRKLPKSALLLMPREEASVITQDRLESLAALQLAAWSSHERAAALSAEIDRAVKRGAAVEVGALAWDPIARMARSRKERQA